MPETFALSMAASAYIGEAHREIGRTWVPLVVSNKSRRVVAAIDDVDK
jgi:hypothetical protein